MRNSAGQDRVGFLGEAQIGLHADNGQTALGAVRSQATEQVTGVDCNDYKDLDLDDFHCKGENEWDCDCNEGFVKVPQARFSRTVIEASSAETIPLQAITTNTTEITDRCYENNQEAARNVNKQVGFSYSGSLESHTWDVQQSCHSQEQTFEEEGCGEYDYDQHSMDFGADCECKPISAANRGKIDTSADCDCVSCLDENKEKTKGNHIDNADEDIEKKVSNEVEKAISDILSDAINRCISSSLKSCISIVNEWAWTLVLLLSH